MAHPCAECVGHHMYSLCRSAAVWGSLWRAKLQVANYARVADSIVGWGSKLGPWSRLENHAVIGEDVHVREEILLNGAIVLPHKEIKETILEPGTIIM